MTARRRSDLEATSWDWSVLQRCCYRETTRILGHGPQAEDAAQEAALRAWHHRAQCRDTARPLAWVRQIAAHEALRLVTRPAGEPAQPPRDQAAEDPDLALRIDVRRAIASLDRTERELLALRYWADVSLEETARLLNMPAGTAKVRLYRSRQRLRTALSAP